MITDIEFPENSEEAIALYQAKWWEGRDEKEVVLFQLQTRHPCMPFMTFWPMLENLLSRHVATWELEYRDVLHDQILNRHP